MSLSDSLMARRRQRASDEIAGTAIELFSRHGFEATSVDAIAKAAGCSSRTFYRYFGSKEEVMFHDLPAVLEQLEAVLNGHLRSGLGPWQAVVESLLAFIGRFDASDQQIATRRLNLWLSEPVLRARYLQYVMQTEHVIARCLHRHGGTMPARDDLPQLIAAAATGAYRVTIATHSPDGETRKLTKHLRTALATLGDGLALAAAAGAVD